MILLHRPLAITAVAVALCFFTASSQAERDTALAGQSVVEPLQGGQHTKEYGRNGQLIYEVIERSKVEGGRTVIEAVEREWSENGTPLRDQTFLGGNEIRGTTWHMNGQVKEQRVDQSVRNPKGPPGTYVERFSDSGTLLSAGVFQGKFRPVGTHREYDETGKLKREITYDARGIRLSERTYDGSGAVSRSARFLPDGSRVGQ
ncbi:MAG: hypothetical protein QHC78_04780 [Pigmentiphaga sp.]|uniref:toxin-antitoxin system YwqK family antitoxin n=1 Tax=Pigmentiphaga sp. TaxID=1977564 RepID=UPI0029BA073F|nr:hypothetical protein [Pigmentiphaga sp.]MDX3904988.1 hypothetical protein [Pigmentiphaga sp.]